MLALRSSPPSFSVAEGERIARDHFGLAAEVAPLSGERDANFRLRTADDRLFVLKIVDLAAEAASCDCLIRTLRQLAEQDPSLPVQRVLAAESGEDLVQFSRAGLPYAACVLTYLPGRLLWEVPVEAPVLQDLGQIMGRIDRALRGFFHPAFDRRLAWDVRRLPELALHADLIASPATRQAVRACAARIGERLPQLRGLRSQAIHGDCHGHNVLVDASGHAVQGILDFGDMLHAPVIFEPAVAMAELSLGGVSQDTLSAVLQGFAGEQALEAADIDVLFDLIEARHAITALLHGWRVVHDAAGAALITETAAQAADSLAEFSHADRAAVTERWHVLAGTRERAGGAVDLARRHRLMGAGAELFYEQPLHLVRGEGVWLYDPDGRAYLDVYNNVPHVGHAHPRVVTAIRRQVGVLATHTRYLHGSVLAYAEALTRHLPSHLDTCIFVNSGSEANDVAWRMAKMATQRDGALVMRHAYHGITDAVGALTPGSGEPQDPWVETVAPPPETLTYADHWDESLGRGEAQRAVAALAARGHGPAAFYIDSGITSSGIFDPPPAWGRSVEQALHAAGALIVADEVQYGLGRSGSHFWGFERRGIRPDLVTLGKPVGNGFPMGVVIAGRALVEQFQAKYGFFSTFGGNAVAAEAGLAVLEVLEDERLQQNAAATGAVLTAGLIDLQSRHAIYGRARGSGLLTGLPVLGADAAQAKQRARRIVNRLVREHRILIGTEGANGSILKLRPPMPFGEQHARLLIEALDAAARAEG